MGRWGYRLFEGDQDIDIACDLTADTGEKVSLVRLVHQTDMLAPPEARLHYKTKAYQAELAIMINEARQKLDAGAGDQLLALCRSREKDHDTKYRTIVAGALIMRAGGRITANDLDHLRSLIPAIKSNFGFTLPFCDQGFRYPGKMQFKAALDFYTPGAPRSFQEPSCFTCGKIEADLGVVPKQCSRCRKAWYCDDDCRRKQWQKHKTICRSPEQTTMLNV